MATDVTMPRLSDSMEEGTILKWIVEKGGEVKRGEPLVEIETDKANMTYEADTDGTLIEVVADEGDTLAVGEVIGRIGDASEAGGGESEKEEEPESDEEEEKPDEASEDEEPQEERDAATASKNGDEAEEESKPKQKSDSSNGAGDGERVKASPVARRMASEMDVDLGSVEGTGPGGRIVKADVEAAAEGGGTKTEKPEQAEAEKPQDDEAPEAEEKQEKKDEKEQPVAAKPPEAEPAGDAGPKGELSVQELTRLQKTVSRRMAESKATAPDFELDIEVDMTMCVELRTRLKELAEHPPSFNDMVVKACGNALREFPRVNGAYRDGRFELYSRVNVGVAVAARDALVVPTINDVDKKSLGEVSRQARELIDKVKDGSITPPELSGGTFTVSNLGMYGIERFSAVINPPQAAILAVGALKKKPVVDEGGRIAARDMMSMTLVCDHRILYGADGAEFLARVRELLEQPLGLAL
jgi:pyruvate dehydrogenase E2 component (dihydrolipoamide acetyltransferase)